MEDLTYLVVPDDISKDLWRFWPFKADFDWQAARIPYTLICRAYVGTTMAPEYKISYRENRISGGIFVSWCLRG